MRQRWLDGPKLDASFHQPILELAGEEVPAPIGLNPLDRNWHLLDDLVQECQRACRHPLWIEGKNPETAAIDDGGALVKARRDLAGVHLHSISRNRTAVATLAFAAALDAEDILPVPHQHFLDSGKRQAEAL